jgi:hypothetical protein
LISIVAFLLCLFSTRFQEPELRNIEVSPLLRGAIGYARCENTITEGGFQPPHIAGKVIAGFSPGQSATTVFTRSLQSYSDFSEAISIENRYFTSDFSSLS